MPTNSVVPLVRDFLQAWRATPGAIEPSHLALEGFINARTFIESKASSLRNLHVARPRAKIKISGSDDLARLSFLNADGGNLLQLLAELRGEAGGHVLHQQHRAGNQRRRDG